MKKAQFSFSWLFAIIAGAAILVLAVYGAVKIGDTQRYQTDTEIAKKISIITDPLQAGFAEGSFGKISFNQETKINNLCFSQGFGKNDISVSTRSGVGEEWQKSGGATSIYNKYIFSSPSQTGKEYFVFSKPFRFPYKISDLIFLTSQEYCFVSPPNRIENEVLGLRMENIKVSEIDNCSSGSTKVCFDSNSGCDINVQGTCMSNCEDAYDEGYVVKQGESLDFVGSLMYAAIFSDKAIYECNVKRLLHRAGEIADVFSEKAELMNARGCNTNLQPDLIVFKAMVMNASMNDLVSLNQFAKQINTENEQELCGLW